MLTAAGEDFSEQSTPARAELQHLKRFHQCWWGCKCNFRGILFGREGSRREREFLTCNLFHASEIPCSLITMPVVNCSIWSLQFCRTMAGDGFLSGSQGGGKSSHGKPPGAQPELAAAGTARAAWGSPGISTHPTEACSLRIRFLSSSLYGKD